MVEDSSLAKESEWINLTARGWRAILARAFHKMQDLRKDHLNRRILELPNKVIMQQSALDTVNTLPTLVG